MNTNKWNNKTLYREWYFDFIHIIHERWLVPNVWGGSRWMGESCGIVRKQHRNPLEIEETK